MCLLGDASNLTFDRSERSLLKMGCAITGKRYRWPAGVVPFDVSDDLQTPGGPAVPGKIQAAIDMWESATKVRFVQRNGEADYARFEQADGCSSAVGRRSGRQRIACIPSQPVATLAHEIGHALGLFHEHQREDRDANVTVNLSNVQPRKAHNFVRHVGDADDVGIYDFDSLMHYPRGLWAVRWDEEGAIAQSSSQAVPAVVAGAKSYNLLHLGASSLAIWQMTSTDGRSWTDEHELWDKSSSARPAAVEFGGVLHMVHKGARSSDVWRARSKDDEMRSWTKDVRIPRHTSRAAPALAVFGGQMHMVHLGSSSDTIYWSRSTNGSDWSDDKPIPDHESSTTPALCEFNQQLHMVHLGATSNALYHSWKPHGRSWTTPRAIAGETSRDTPGLAAHDGILHMVHVGRRSANLWHSQFDGSDWEASVTDYRGTSRAGPVLFRAGADLRMIHLGEDSKLLWRARYAPGKIVIKSKKPIGSAARPSAGDIAAVNQMYP